MTRKPGWIARSRLRRQQRDDVTVLACLVLGDEHYTQIWTRTGLSSAVVYPALVRLEAADLVDSDWDDGVEPPRRCYWPTTAARDLFGRTA